MLVDTKMVTVIAGGAAPTVQFKTAAAPGATTVLQPGHVLGASHNAVSSAGMGAPLSHVQDAATAAAIQQLQTPKVSQFSFSAEEQLQDGVYWKGCGTHWKQFVSEVLIAAQADFCDFGQLPKRQCFA